MPNHYGLTPAFSTGTAATGGPGNDQDLVARLLEALVMQSPTGIPRATMEMVGDVGSAVSGVAGLIGQPQRAVEAGRQLRRTLPDIASALGAGGPQTPMADLYKPAAYNAVGGLLEGMESEVLDKGLGAFIGVEDFAGPAGKLAGVLGAASMMKAPNIKASKAVQDIVDLSKARQTPRQMRLQELADEQVARGEVPGALERGRLEKSYSEYDGNKIEEFSKSEDFSALADLFDQPTKMGNLQRRMDAEKSLDQLANLDDVEKARLDRAVQQGFNIDAFHGTKGDIESFDPGLLGATTGAPSARRGFFFSADPETAHNYIEMSSLEDVRPSLINEIENTVEDLGKEVLALDEEVNKQKYNINSKTHGNNWRSARKDFVNEYVQKTKLKEKDQKLQNYKRILREEQDFESKTGGNILPVKLRLQNPLEYDFGGKAYRDVTYNDLLKQAQEAGNDGAIFRNTTDGGGVTDIYVVFEPSQIRSRYAAFDPKEGASGSLIANAPPILFPLGVGTAAAAYSANQEQ